MRSVTINLGSDDRLIRSIRSRRVMREGQADYEVELTACFVFSIRSKLEGPRGLTRDEIEELIEANWLWVSLDTEVLLESHWQLESFAERAEPGA